MHSLALLILRIEFAATQVDIIDVCEEQLAIGTHLKLVVVFRVAVRRGYEELDSIFSVEWRIAALEGRYDVTIGVCEVDVQVLDVMADVHNCGCRPSTRSILIKCKVVDSTNVSLPILGKVEQPTVLVLHPRTEWNFEDSL